MSLKDIATPISNLPPHAYQSYTQIVIDELLTMPPGTCVSFSRLIVHLTDKYGDTPREWRVRVNHVFDNGNHRVTTLKRFMKTCVRGVSTIIRGEESCQDTIVRNATPATQSTLH